jgi:hypothetical protein
MTFVNLIKKIVFERKTILDSILKIKLKNEIRFKFFHFDDY